MRQSIRKLMTLLLLFTCSIGVWAQATQGDDVPSIPLSHTFGDKATVTFYLFNVDGDVLEPTADFVNSVKNNAGVTKLVYCTHVVAHVVPKAGYWTDVNLLYGKETVNENLVQQQVQTRASIEAGNEVKLIQLDGGRNDGAGWYYYRFPEEHSDFNIYTASILDGYVLPKFDLSKATASTDGLTYTMTEGDWTTTLTIDEGKTSFDYSGSAQGPTKLTNTSIVVKHGDDAAVTFAKVEDHVSAALYAEGNSSRTSIKAVDAGSYYLRLQAARTESDASTQIAPAGNTRSGQNSASVNTVETGIFTSFKDVEFVINPKSLNYNDNKLVTLTAENKVYDGTTKATVTATVKTGVDGEELTFNELKATFDNKNVGKNKTVTLTLTENDVKVANEKTKLANYNVILPETTTADITAKALTITAEAKTKVFGEADPTLTYTKEGLLEGDAMTGALARAEGENVGEYAITQGTLSAGDNYTITFTGAKLTVTAKTIKDNPDGTKGEGAIAIVLDPTEYTYDKTEKKPAVTVKDGETTVAASEYQVAYKDNVNAGTATVTITDNEGGNYTVSGTKTFTIKKAKLTITAEAKEKKAGEADPTLAYKAEGLVTGDAITGALARAEGEDVGEYAITQGTLSAGDNYEVTFVGAKLTINSADFAEGDVKAEGYEGTYDGKAHTITVTAPKSATVKYGKANGTYDLTEAPTYTNAGENTVYYQVTMANTNPVTGSQTVIIKKAKLTITAEAKEKVEGEADPVLTYTVTGLVEGEKLSGELTREAGETAGTYAIQQGTLKASDNYEVTYAGANLTIKAAPAPTPTETTYKVRVSNSIGGEVIVTKMEAKAGDQVNLIIKIDEGYHLESLSAAKQKGGNVNIGVTTDKDGKEYNYFKMPADNVLVTALFAKDEMPDENKQNIFIFKTKYGEVVSHVLYAPEGLQVNLETRPVKGYESCILDELYVYNEKFDPLPIKTIKDPKEGLVYYFFMKGEKAFVYNTFKGTNGIVDESQALPPDYRLYLFTNVAQNFLQTNKDSKDVQLALSLVANILATFTPEGELKVNKGIEDMIMGLINLKTGWLIKIDFEGTLKALAPQLLQIINSKTRGTEEGTPLDSDGTILSGVYYRVLEDTNLEFLLESTTGPLLIKSISVMAPEDDDPTAINRLQADDADADIYDLSGRKVDPTIRLPKGVYIRNGKKVVMK